MKKSIINIGKSFVRGHFFIISFALFCLISNILLMKLYNANQSAIEYLSDALRLGQIGLTYFTFLSYEYFSSISDCNLELSFSLSGATRKVILGYLIMMCSLLLFWTANILVWQFCFYFIKRVYFPKFITHIVLSVILNCFVPGCIGMLLGIVLSLLVKRSVAYCVVLIFLLISSRIPYQVFASEKILGVPILNIFDWFSILMPNSEYIADSVYGIANEVCRWLLGLMWVCLFLSTILWLTRKSNGAFPKVFFVICVLVCCVCGTCFAARGDDSLVRKDLRAEGTIYGENSYREENPPGEEKSAEFNVTGYELYLSVGNELKTTAVVKLQQNDLCKYYFTLWHNLEITCISDGDDNSLQYEREGDYITVFTSPQTEKIQFQYIGNCGKYFSNRQGIALPGYIPFYPMAGHISLWNDVNQEINVKHSLPKTLFYVEVDSALDVKCNLQEIAENTFVGESETVSLYAGLLSENMVDNHLCYSSPVTDRQVSLHGLEQMWCEISQLVGEDETLPFANKTIFVQPETVMVTNSGQEDIVVFSDHMILGSWTTDSKSICLKYLYSLIPDCINKKMIAELFMTYLFWGDDERNVASKPTWDSIEILTRYNSAGEIKEYEDWKEYISVQNTLLKELWYYQESYLGRSVLVREVYQYLLDPQHTEEQVAFLYNLGG